MLNFMKYRNVWFVSVVVLLTVLFLGCNVKDRVPSHIPSKKKMATILADIHLVEDAMNLSNVSLRPQQLGHYKDVLERHGLSQADFDSALSWYSAHPNVYLKVYDQVIQILTQHEARLQQEITARSEAEKDSASAIKDLWTLERSFVLPLHDSLDATLPFVFAVDSLKNGKIKLSAWFTYKKDDLGKKDEMVLVTCYADSTRDTLRTGITKSYSRTNALLTKVLKQDTAVVSLEGFLLFHDKKHKRHLSIEEVSLEHIPLAPEKKP